MASLGRAFTDPLVRFERYVRREENGCWTWTGTFGKKGYGQFGLARPRRTVRAHRWYYEQVAGPIAPGLALDHLCRNRACVNPAHLEPVTTAENNRRSAIANGWGAPGQAHRVFPHRRVAYCQRGHSMQNAYQYPDGTRRCCRECQRLYRCEYCRRKAMQRASAEVAMR